MAVKVYDSKTPETYEHGAGTGLDVRDGHLIVVTSNGASPTDRIAVYAPGKWERAEVTK
jgi:hypothetical protein